MALIEVGVRTKGGKELFTTYIILCNLSNLIGFYVMENAVP